MRFAGPVWRIVPRTLVECVATPAGAPEGRFHHSGQFAIYASLSAEGAMVAVQRYLGDGNERSVLPLWFDAQRVADQRGNAAASVVWQDFRERGALAPTWAFSDAARRRGAQAMLYSSRSRPDLAHVVVFEPDCLRATGAAQPFKP